MEKGPKGELFDKVVKESDKVIMMSKVKPSPKIALTSKNHYNKTN